MAASAARNPSPGADSAALETISAALSAASSLLQRGDDGVRPAIDLLFRSMALAATVSPDGL
jgi:hypothetical protein